MTARKILGEDVAARVKPMWGVDEEGEQRNVWRDTGVPNFWFMMGNLMWCRFHSKHVALRESLSLSPISLPVCLPAGQWTLGAVWLTAVGSLRRACRDQGYRGGHPWWQRE